MNPILKLTGESEDFSEYEDILALDAEQEKTLFNRPAPLTPKEAYKEAWHLGKGNVPEELERIVAKHPRSAFGYARDVLRAPFPLGEPAIATDGSFSFVYARDILKARFPLGEPAIRNSGYWLEYCTRFYMNEPSPKSVNK